jgi:hypothetical protein
MGRKIQLVSFVGICPTHRAAAFYSLDPVMTDDLPACPNCEMRLSVSDIKVVPAWQADDRQCFLLAQETPKQPADLEKHRRREGLIRKLGRAACDKLGVKPNRLPHGLVTVIVSDGGCNGCSRNTRELFLTAYGFQRRSCPGCGSSNGYRTEADGKHFPAALDDRDFCHLLVSPEPIPLLAIGPPGRVEGIVVLSADDMALLTGGTK